MDTNGDADVNEDEHEDEHEDDAKWERYKIYGGRNGLGGYQVG